MLVADIEMEQSGLTALEISTEMPNAFSILLQRKAKHRLAIIHTAYENHPETMALIIQYGTNLDIRSSSNKTSLMISSEKNSVNCVKLLIDAGADLNLQNDNGDTALITALRRGNKAVAIILLIAGADHRIQNNRGETADKITNDDDIQSLIQNNLKKYNQCKISQKESLQANNRYSLKQYIHKKRAP